MSEPYVVMANYEDNDLLQVEELMKLCSRGREPWTDRSACFHLTGKPPVNISEVYLISN